MYTKTKALIMNIKLLTLSLILLNYVIISCEKNFTAQDLRNIKLTVESVESVELWLKLEVTPLDKENIYTVKRDTFTVFSGKLEKNDTLIHDINLEPSCNYTYTIFSNKKNVFETETTTMDTTSHIFNMVEYFFGDGGGWWNDVCVIDEDDIWVVGKVYRQDTLYNSAHWDGKEWILHRIPRSFNNNTIYGELFAIDRVAHNDIWFSGGATLVHWDGKSFKTVVFFKEFLYSENYAPLNVLRVVDSTVYGGSFNGNLIRFDGTDWQKLETNSMLQIPDIYHIKSTNGEQPYILALVSEVYLPSTDMVIKITGTDVEPVFNWPNDFETPYSIWYMDKQKVWVAGGSMYIRGLDKQWQVDSTFSYSSFIFAIRGNDKNDIFIVGDNNYISHFNGKSWHTLFDNFYGGRYYRLSTTPVFMATVGFKNGKATVLMLHR